MDGASRFPLFDGLRALAVIGVAYSHWMPERLQFGIPWGRIGVQLFFVLSGFLITTILLRERRKLAEHDAAARWGLIRAFAARRALRIFPIYWITLSIAFALGVTEVRESFWWHFLYASNIYFAIEREWAGATSHLWTLAVEEQFYLVWPLLIVLMVPSWRARAIVGVVATCALTSMLLGLAPTQDRTFLALLPIPAFLGVAAGALMAIAADRGPRHLAIGSPLVIAATTATLGLVLVLSESAGRPAQLGHALSPFAIVVFACSVIAWAAAPRSGLVPAVLRAPPMVFLGTVSYGFYLYHNFIPSGLAYAISEGWIPQSVNWGLQAPLIRFALTLAFAVVSWYAIERPLARMRTRIPYVVSGRDRDQR